MDHDDGPVMGGLEARVGQQVGGELLSAPGGLAAQVDADARDIALRGLRGGVERNLLGERPGADAG